LLGNALAKGKRPADAQTGAGKKRAPDERRARAEDDAAS
jgi:hypothetical protein